MGERLTENDVKKIQAEIEYRKLTVRKEAIEAVKEARAQERMLKTAEIVSEDSKADEAGMNNVIEVYFEDDDETETYKLVTSIRGNSLDNKISIESPLGKAILGHREGDRVWVKINESAGYYIVIKKILKNTDDTEDEIKSF